MILNSDCIVCSIKNALNLFKEGYLDSKYQEKTLKKILEYYSNVNYDQFSLLAWREVRNIIEEVTGVSDPFKSLKDKYNKKAIQYCEKYENIIKNNPNPFDKAMRLAIAGNIIDFGPAHNFNVEKKIEEVFEVKFPIDDSEELFKQIKQARSILYLGDNTGEIVFDRLFLEIIDHPNVIFAVRHSPILNDATMEDALSVGIDKIAKIITNGDNAPGTLLDEVSKEFLDYFNSVDLIISKGQGNFEGLSHIKDKNIFFLLTIKCQLIGDQVGVNYGDCIVKSTLNKKAAKL